jgi:drug/metabolite transporter (DMT)-like permease
MALPFLGLWLWQSGDGIPSGTRAWVGLAYVGAFEMGITFVLWQRALQTAKSVARVTAVVYLAPFLSLGFIFIVLREPFSPFVFVGLGLIVAGVVLQKSPV